VATGYGSGYVQDDRFIAVNGIGRLVRGIAEDTQDRCG
jgi:hypothetical protein